MFWPVRSVEHSRGFVPSFCPHRRCLQHLCQDPSRFRFRPRGFYSTRRRRTIRRYRCLECRRSFSQQSFATSYFLKRPELLAPTAAGLVAGSAHRQIARSLGCAASTITRLSARLGRHSLLLQARCLSYLYGQLSESVVIDHFETFEFAQDYPFGVGMAVGSASWFVYVIDPAPHRRAGRRSSAHQARRLRRHRRDLRGGYSASSRRLLGTLARLGNGRMPVQVIGDGHASYRRAAATLGTDAIGLTSYPNPKRGPRGSPRSVYARRRDAAMFPSDVLHALLRHSVAHHRRETIAFGRRINALMERFFLATAWRNFIKARSERKPDASTPAMALQLADKAWSWKRLLGLRLFAGRESPPQVWRELYTRSWHTPLVGRNTSHDLKLAY